MYGVFMCMEKSVCKQGWFGLCIWVCLHVGDVASLWGVHVHVSGWVRVHDWVCMGIVYAWVPVSARTCVHACKSACVHVSGCICVIELNYCVTGSSYESTRMVFQQPTYTFKLTVTLYSAATAAVQPLLPLYLQAVSNQPGFIKNSADLVWEGPSIQQMACRHIISLAFLLALNRCYKNFDCQ